MPTSPIPQPPGLTYAIMGAGAVGCYFGALLARAGSTVCLIGRQPHVQAIAQQGLRLETATQDAFIPMTASTEASAAQGANVVLLCVKSYDTEAACLALKHYLAPGTLVVSLQNGVDNDVRARTVLGPEIHVAAAAVYVATAMAGPGHVRHFGRGELMLAPSPLSQRLAQGLHAAGIHVEVSDNAQEALWSKLIINCAYNALSALTQQPYGWLVQQPGAWAVIDDLVGECMAVAQAAGVTIPGDVVAAVRTIAQTMPGQLSSTAQDMARGKATEIEHLNGFIVRCGAELGVATPANRALLVLVRMLQLRSTHC